jgi:hypothetical protein
MPPLKEQVVLLGSMLGPVMLGSSVLLGSIAPIVLGSVALLGSSSLDLPFCCHLICRFAVTRFIVSLLLDLPPFCRCSICRCSICRCSICRCSICRCSIRRLAITGFAVTGFAVTGFAITGFAVNFAPRRSLSSSLLVLSRSFAMVSLVAACCCACFFLS